MRRCLYCGAEFLPRLMSFQNLWCSARCERDHGEQHEQEKVVDPDWRRHP